MVGLLFAIWCLTCQPCRLSSLLQPTIFTTLTLNEYLLIFFPKLKWHEWATHDTVKCWQMSAPSTFTLNIAHCTVCIYFEYCSLHYLIVWGHGSSPCTLLTHVVQCMMGETKIRLNLHFWFSHTRIWPPKPWIFWVCFYNGDWRV